jgi:hypothetical protein
MKQLTTVLGAYGPQFKLSRHAQRAEEIILTLRALRSPALLNYLDWCQIKDIVLSNGHKTPGA